MSDRRAKAKARAREWWLKCGRVVCEVTAPGAKDLIPEIADLILSVQEEAAFEKALREAHDKWRDTVNRAQKLAERDAEVKRVVEEVRDSGEFSAQHLTTHPITTVCDEILRRLGLAPPFTTT